MKGADAVMLPMIRYNDWLEEECGNMARVGLRTLIFGKRYISPEEYQTFLQRYKDAQTALEYRCTTYLCCHTRVGMRENYHHFSRLRCSFSLLYADTLLLSWPGTCG